MLPKLDASKFIRQARTVDGQGYVYGMRGKDSPCTIAMLRSKDKQYGAKLGKGYYHKDGDYTKGKCARWLGKFATDCSGLVRWAYWRLTNVDFSKSADGLFRECTQRGTMDTFEPQAGVLLFKANSAGRKTHVGIYTGEGNVLQAGGVIYGIKEEPMKSGWTHWGIISWMTMDIPKDGTKVEPDKAENPSGDASTGKPEDTVLDFNAVPYIRYKDKGHLVAYMQNLLVQAGYPMPGSTRISGDYGMDGIYGAETRTVLRKFQLEKIGRKEVDGICGPKTWTALTGTPCK